MDILILNAISGIMKVMHNYSFFLIPYASDGKT